MSALSFLSKKSWHTGLQSNQEAVWKAEKAALEERKKLDELRKERERERELEELERLNVESGGKKARRQERVDWMYQVPASIASSSTTQQESNQEELEEYLLGKKRVDNLLNKGDESEKLSRHGSAPQSQSSATSGAGNALGGGNANSDRDLASKIREDPMFAIRQQEQAAYQALLKDPARLRAMRKAAGMDVDKGESKEERRRRKEERRRRREEHEEDRDRHSRRSDSRHHRHEEYRSSRRRDDDRDYHKAEYERNYTRSRYDEERTRKGDDDDGPGRSMYSRESRRDHKYGDHPSHSYNDGKEYDKTSRRSRSPYSSRQPGKRDQSARSPSSRPYRETRYDNQSTSSRHQRNVDVDAASVDAARQAKLDAMQKNAEDLSSSRTTYLSKMKEKEDEDLAREEALRAKVQQSRAKANGSLGSGFGKEAKGSFLIEQERSMYGGKGVDKIDLADRLKRGRDTLQRFEAD